MPVNLDPVAIPALGLLVVAPSGAVRTRAAEAGDEAAETAVQLRTPAEKSQMC